MKLSDKIQVELNEARNRVLELAEIEEPTDENRSELEDLRTKMKSLGERHAVALEAEEIEIREIANDPDQEDGEARELSNLITVASVSPFLKAAFENRALEDGPEAELLAALEITENRDFPMALLVDWTGEEERQQNMLRGEEEHRVDAITNTSISTMVTSGMWLSRLMATTNAQFIGVTTRPVGPGDHVYPYVAGSAEASFPSKNAAVDAVAGTIDSETHTPNAVQTRYLINEEDKIRLGSAYENALRRDLRDQLMAGLDKYVFADATAGMLTTIPAVTGDADINAQSTFEAMHTNVLDAIDGLYASELMDLNVSVNPKAHGRMGAVSPSGTAAFLTDYLKAQGCRVRANAHIAGITGKTNQTYALVSRSRGISGAAIMSVYRSGSMMLDTYGDFQRKRQTAINVVGYFDFSVVRAANWIKFRIRH